jgi:hypothetical protein
MEDFWDENNILVDLLFETNLSQKDIAKELGWTEYKVAARIRELGLQWVKRKNRKLSRGAASLLTIMQKLFPNEEVVVEYPVGERLRLDVYCPRYKVAAEYHGRQHFYYVEHYHGNLRGFEEAQERDQRKIELCQEQGISLISLRYNDELSEQTVFDRLMTSLQATPAVRTERVSAFKGNPYYEAQKQRQREWRRKQYREMKQRKKR